MAARIIARGLIAGLLLAMGDTARRDQVTDLDEEPAQVTAPIVRVAPGQADQLAAIVSQAPARATILLEDGLYQSSLESEGQRRLIFNQPGLTLRSLNPTRPTKELSMLKAVRQLDYAIVLCDDLERMKTFYRALFDFPVNSESATGLTFCAGGVLLSLRQRTRPYDGCGTRPEVPGVQLAFRVAPEEVDQCYEQLLAGQVPILDPPTDQPRGHRTVYFADPEGNVLEVYAEI